MRLSRAGSRAAAHAVRRARVPHACANDRRVAADERRAAVRRAERRSRRRQPPRRRRTTSPSTRSRRSSEWSSRARKAHRTSPSIPRRVIDPDSAARRRSAASPLVGDHDRRRAGRGVLPAARASRTRSRAQGDLGSSATGLGSTPDELSAGEEGATRKKVGRADEHRGASARARATPRVKNLPSLDDPAMAPLRALLEDPAVKKTAQNAKYDLLVAARRRRHAARPRLRHDGRELRARSGPTLARARSARARVPRPQDDELRGALRQGQRRDSVRSGPDRVRARLLVRGRRHDVAAARAMFEPQLEALQLARAVSRHRDAARRRARRDGVDTASRSTSHWFASLKERFERERQRVEQEIYASAGEEFNINSNPQAARDPVRASCKLPVLKKTATGPSTDASVLQQLADEGHQLPVLLMEYRELAKLESTYIDALPRYVHPHTRRAAHVVQPDGRRDRPALVERAESSEHSDSPRARARHSPRVHSAGGLDAARRRLLADRAAAARASVGRPGVRAGVSSRAATSTARRRR